MALGHDVPGVVDVVARQSGGSTAALELSSVPVAGLDVVIAAGERTPTTTRWRVTLRWEPGRTTDTVIAFEATRSGAVVGTAALAVKATKTAPTGEVVDVSLVTSMVRLQEARPQDVYVVVRNTSGSPVAVNRMSATVSSDMRVCHRRTEPAAHSDADRCGHEQRVRLPRKVAPGTTALFRFRIEATPRSRAGEHQALFTTEVSYQEAGVTRRAGVVLSRDFEYSVLGESDFLTAVGVPSFLLLPGFLVLMAYRIPARRARARGVDLPPIDASAPEFLAVSATLSILAIPVYWLATAATGNARTYLQGYGIRDLLQVWIASVVIGFAAFAVPWAVQTYRIRMTTPQPTDDAERVLRRLARAHSQLVLPQVRFTVGPDSVRQAFRVPSPTGEAEGLWCVPAIDCAIAPGVPEVRARELQQAMSGPAEDFWRLCEGRSDVSFAWAPGAIRQPVRTTADAIVAEVAAAPLLRQSLPGGVDEH
ncbi:hypothetical protein [Streptomyces sp. cmx-18-6]|uniref:hypothetical protein n=1 Tax=Streptomyces sp. cmx-18-6 TaxID=2790930 RepID=UPI00397FB0AC